MERPLGVSFGLGCAMEKLLRHEGSNELRSLGTSNLFEKTLLVYVLQDHFPREESSLNSEKSQSLMCFQ